jgi:hypothetical protein
VKRKLGQNPALRSMQITWVVYEGRPSWHQRRAGHSWAASTVFTGDDAEDRARALLAGYAKHHPDMLTDIRCVLVPIR